MKIFVGKKTDLDRGPLVVEVAGRPVAVFKTKGGYRAVSNTCPHQNGPLAEGFVDGESVTCPWHAWTFDLKSGKCKDVPQAKVSTYRVVLKKDELFVETPF